jgi:hypothetical protein
MRTQKLYNLHSPSPYEHKDHTSSQNLILESKQYKSRNAMLSDVKQQSKYSHLATFLQQNLNEDIKNTSGKTLKNLRRKLKKEDISIYGDYQVDWYKSKTKSDHHDSGSRNLTGTMRNLTEPSKKQDGEGSQPLAIDSYNFNSNLVNEIKRKAYENHEAY